MSAEGIPISVIETSTSGWLLRKARSASTTIAAPALENVPTRTLPTERSAIASTSSAAAAICSNAAAARWPARSRLCQPERPDARVADPCAERTAAGAAPEGGRRLVVIGRQCAASAMKPPKRQSSPRRGALTRVRRAGRSAPSDFSFIVLRTPRDASTKCGSVQTFDRALARLDRVRKAPLAEGNRPGVAAVQVNVGLAAVTHRAGDPRDNRLCVQRSAGISRTPPRGSRGAGCHRCRSSQGGAE